MWNAEWWLPESGEAESDLRGGAAPLGPPVQLQSCPKMELRAGVHGVKCGLQRWCVVEGEGDLGMFGIGKVTREALIFQFSL